MSKLTGFLLSLACLFIGIVAGFMMAPIKKGISIGNNSGNNFVPRNENDAEDEEDEDELEGI